MSNEQRHRLDAAKPANDPLVQPFQVGDPVMDAAQGRAMIVLDAPEQTVEEWSDANDYDLQENYANGKFQPHSEEAVVECVYVSDVRSEPSKTYTFPVSRVRLIDAHHADDGPRVAERVQSSLLVGLFEEASDPEAKITPEYLAAFLTDAGVRDGVVVKAREIADAGRIGENDGE